MRSELLKRADAFVEKYGEMAAPDYRPGYHMLPPLGWINDPNGFCRYQGKYHLYYQYFPYSPVNLKMYWGHSSSEDLVSWQYHPVALAPDQPYDEMGVFSGTAYVEGTEMTLMYTGVSVNEQGEYRQTQCIATSADGDTFVKDESNPVIPTALLPEGLKKEDFRDPKVWKHGDTFYCLTVAVDPHGFGKLLLHSSRDMISWQYVGAPLSGEGMDLGNLWECPDYFQLDGKDVIIVSTGQANPKGDKFANVNEVVYFIGHFDVENASFTVESYDQLDDGTDFYAPQTILDDKGRRVLIAWQQMWARNCPTAELGHQWTGHMTLPRILSIKEGRLWQAPVSELAAYEKETVSHEKVRVSTPQALEGVNGDQVHLSVKLEMENSWRAVISLLKTEDERVTLTYDKAASTLVLDRSHGGYPISGGEMKKGACNRAVIALEGSPETLNLNIYLDRSAIEIFCPDNGRSLSTRAFPRRMGQDISFEADGEAVVTVTTSSLKK